MTIGKIKIHWVVILAATMSIFCAVGQCGEQPGGNGHPANVPASGSTDSSENRSENDSAKDSADSLTDNGKLDKLFEDNGSSIPKNELFRQFAIAISLVLVLSGCAYWLSKRVMPKLAVTRGKKIRVVETIHLGTNRRIHLLEIDDDRRILIGSTTQNISFLADMNRGQGLKDVGMDVNMDVDMDVDMDRGQTAEDVEDGRV